MLPINWTFNLEQIEINKERTPDVNLADWINRHKLIWLLLRLAVRKVNICEGDGYFTHSLYVRVSKEVVSELKQVRRDPREYECENMIGHRITSHSAKSLIILKCHQGPDSEWHSPGCSHAWPALLRWRDTSRRRASPSASGQSRLGPQQVILSSSKIVSFHDLLFPA